MFKHFQARLRLSVLPLSILLLAGPALAAPSAQAILAQTDAIRNPSRPFSVTVNLIEYRAARQTDANSIAVLSKVDPANGQFRSILRFLAPARDANKLILKNGADLWFFDPASKASIRIAPQQRLLGQAANGDVVTVNLSKDYKAELGGEEDLQDGEGKPRHAYRLLLAAVTPDVTYHHIEMWVDRSGGEPLKAKFYTESKRLLKTAYYRKYALQLGAMRPTETVIIDGLDPAWVTVMRNVDYAWRDVPEAWLQRDYLPSFKAD